MGLEREDVVVKETVVMDTPDRNKNQISTPISKFEDSPVFNFLNNLSPIMPVKTVQLTQPLNSLSFASVPSVFTSPHVSSIKGSRFLRRHQLSDPSGPEFSSDDSVRVDADEGNSDAVNYSNVKEKFGPTTSELEASPVPSSECSKLTFELLRTVNYECSSPSILSSCVIRSACLSDFSGRSAVCAPLVQEISEKGVPSDEASMEGVSQIEKNEEASACDWESLISGATDILIFDSPSDPEAFTKERDPCFRPYDFVSSGMLNSKGGSGEEGGDGNDLENQSTQPGEEIELQECIESQSMVLDSSLTNNAIAEGPSKKVDNEAISSLYSGMRRRCLVFEMVGARNKQTGENCGSSGSGSSSEQQAGGNPASDKKQLIPQKTVNESSRCILPGIGLHLNALAATSKDGKVIKHESNTSSKQLFIASRSAINSEPVTIVHESPNESPPLTSTKGAIVQLENASETPGYMAKEDLNQSCKKRRKLEPDEGEACKRCNCKKSKCLKLYCECFAAGVYCVGTCSCQDCFNKPMHEDTVLATRTLIESRNPLAFAPKVIKSCDSLSQTWDDSSKTPASARHKRGCNCKRSGCLKKYCECYQGGVGCSIGCRCEGCKNTFGRKDGTDYVEEEETNICKKSIVDTLSQKSLVQSDTEKNLDSAHPATPLKFGRLPMQLQFPLKNKPPRSSLLSIGSSSGKDAGPGISRPNFIPSQPIFNKRGDSNQEDEIPEVLQGTGSPTSTIKSASPNSKRVSPPHYNTGISPGPRRSRKLILKSIPSFPSLTPNP